VACPPRKNAQEGQMSHFGYFSTVLKRSQCVKAINWKQKGDSCFCMKSSSGKMQKNPKRRGTAGSGRLPKKKVDCFFTTDDSAIFFHKNMLQ
jgi:hypothetical protein